MIERTGDVFTTDATYIGHGANTKGLMGAGIALAIREKFPVNYLEYSRICRENLATPGDFSAIPDSGRVIVNFYSQQFPGPDAQYEWVANSFMSFARMASHPLRLDNHGNKIAIPQIGCGIGGLQWEPVKKIVEAVEACYPAIEWELWTYEV